MKRLTGFLLGLATIVLAGCSLAADITPPPGAGSNTDLPEATATLAPALPEAEVTPTRDGVPEPTTEPVEEPSAAADATAVITGTVTNRSTGEFVAGLEVTLQAFDEMQNVFSETAPVAEDGQFRFEQLPIQEGRAFLASVEYAGVAFNSNVVVVEAGVTAYTLSIEIYDTTADTSRLVIDRLHLFLEPVENEVVRVIELVIISNPGTLAIAPIRADAPALTFLLPQGAANLEFQDGELGGRYVATPGGFGDLSLIYPGQMSYQLMFAYELPLARKLDFKQEMLLPASAVVVMAPDAALKVKGPGVTDAGTREVEGFQYRTYNRDGLAAGESLELVIQASTGTSTLALASGSQTGLVVGLALLGLVCIGGGFYLYRRSRSGSESESPVAAAEGVETKESLMDAILALDDLYQAGELPEAAYQARREELKSKLRQKMG